VNKVFAVLLAGIVLQGCSVGSMTGKDWIKAINTGKNINKITTAGVSEELTNCVKDLFDPGNRGSGC
tara:strand:+ start:2675 stop:2875 length:201 start_codon:yes stop_codon:yes gene_type:complete